MRIVRRSGAVRLLFISTLTVFAAAGLAARLSQRRAAPLPPGPMLDQGLEKFSTPDFDLSLVRSSQTVAALQPRGAGGFDFTPGDLLKARSRDGYYHLGDLDLRLRVVAENGGSSGDWKDYSTALARAPVTPLPRSRKYLAAADLTAALPADIPLRVRREWSLENGKLVLRFTLENRAAQAVEVGGLGIPMVFNNILSDRTLEQAHAACSFYDPYIGEDAGYLQVTRLNGHGPALLVVPDGKTPFEAYKPILNPQPYRGPRTQPQIFTDLTPRSNTFEGFYDWMVYSQAFAENEWKNAQPWNPPALLRLSPGEARTIGVKFLVSDSIRDIEKTLTAAARPVAVGIPGYILPEDIHGQLFLKYPAAVSSISADPPGSLAAKAEPARAAAGAWKAYEVDGKNWGRSRLTIRYRDGLVQTINYFVTKPEAEAVADMGRFLTTEQWFTKADDPFHRAPSVISYDHELNQQVTQDVRVWIAGLSDEGGAGSWLAAFMKNFGQPDPGQLAKLQQFVDGVLWGHLQYSQGDRQYGVRKSLFYHQPDEFPAGFYRADLDWRNWWSWNKHDAERTDRSYNYPHVVAAYWVMYRLARDHQGLVADHDWKWYLEQAYQTSMAMPKLAPYYAQFGQMEGDIFLRLLKDLQREGMTGEANTLEAAMKTRADKWRAEPYPFGSEMPWDSTGQEEVYAWMKYFGWQPKAQVTLDAVLGYDPAIPHWGYNGSARRYWDFIYGGAARYSRLERQLHHYGSGINAIPLLAQYRENPNDFYLLRVGYAGTMGAIADVAKDGFLAPAFHAFPDMLRFDPLSGDNGPNFFGHAWNTATYIAKPPDFGWVVFGGNLQRRGEIVKVTPLDSFRRRVYIAPLGLWLRLEAGGFTSVEVNARTGLVRVTLAAADPYTPSALLRIEQPAKIKGVGSYAPRRKYDTARGDFVIPLGSAETSVDITPGSSK